MIIGIGGARDDRTGDGLFESPARAPADVGTRVDGFFVRSLRALADRRLAVSDAEGEIGKKFVERVAAAHARRSEPVDTAEAAEGFVGAIGVAFDVAETRF